MKTLSVHVPYLSIFHFEGGKIASQQDMYDTLHYLVQLGVIASPFTAKAPASPSPAAPAR